MAMETQGNEQEDQSIDNSVIRGRGSLLQGDRKQLIPTGILAVFVAVIKGGVYLPLLFLLILCFHHRSSGMCPARKRKLLYLDQLLPLSCYQHLPL